MERNTLISITSRSARSRWLASHRINAPSHFKARVAANDIERADEHSSPIDLVWTVPRGNVGHGRHRDARA